MRMTGRVFFASSMKKGEEFDVPDGIVANLTRACRREVRDRKVLTVTAGLFEKTPDKMKDDPEQIADL
jgi:hypothetical protein